MKSKNDPEHTCLGFSFAHHLDIRSGGGFRIKEKPQPDGWGPTRVDLQLESWIKHPQDKLVGGEGLARSYDRAPCRMTGRTSTELHPHRMKYTNIKINIYQ